jgi:DNA-binding winged helix-turn-helix (wHTH) protein
MPVYRLQRFELRPDERQLQLGGAPVALGARALDVLLALVEHRDRVVTKNELLERVWPGLVVEENNLQVQVSTLRKLLGASAITTVPGRGYRFTLSVTRIEEEPSPSPTCSAAAPRGNLPRPVGVLHGREADLAAVTELLATSALVSLVGPGGIGKTRLGLAVANSMREAPRDGRWLVNLAPIADKDLAVAEVARVLGLPNPKSGATAVAEALAGQSLLLVLDNCEHLIDAVAPLVDALLRSAPDVRVVVTSQEPLKIAAERVYRLEGLAVPPAHPAGDTMDYGAMCLFLERAQSLDPKFSPDAATLAAIAEIAAALTASRWRLSSLQHGCLSSASKACACVWASAFEC